MHRPHPSPIAEEKASHRDDPHHHHPSHRDEKLNLSESGSSDEDDDESAIRQPAVPFVPGGEGEIIDVRNIPTHRYRLVMCDSPSRLLQSLLNIARGHSVQC